MPEMARGIEMLVFVSGVFFLCKENMGSIEIREEKAVAAYEKYPQ